MRLMLWCNSRRKCFGDKVPCNKRNDISASFCSIFLSLFSTTTIHCTAFYSSALSVCICRNLCQMNEAFFYLFLFIFCSFLLPLHSFLFPFFILCSRKKKLIYALCVCGVSFAVSTWTLAHHARCSLSFLLLLAISSRPWKLISILQWS